MKEPIIVQEKQIIVLKNHLLNSHKINKKLLTLFNSQKFFQVINKIIIK
jgi:hypothetical protein